MSKRAVVAIITAFTLLLLVPAAAPAKVKTFSGRSTATGSEVRFDVKGKKNKKGQFKATRALNFLVFEEYFACYTADGGGPVQEGRTDSYPWIGIPPTDVNKKGKFSSTYSHESSGVTLQRLQFDGEIEGKKAHGTYRAQMSEGGIEFGYCGDKEPVEWKAKR